jgi:hypothetical protein
MVLPLKQPIVARIATMTVSRIHLTEKCSIQANDRSPSLDTLNKARHASTS